MVPHGWFRVDAWDLTPYLRPGWNVVALEVAGYNVDAYYLLNQPAFLQAEVIAGNRVVAATGAENGFLALPLTYRVRKVARYTMQRPFSEVYRLSPKDLAWRTASSTRDSSRRGGGSAGPGALAAAGRGPSGLPYRGSRRRSGARAAAGGRP